MSVGDARQLALVLVAAAGAFGTGCGTGTDCGPTSGVVAHVIDGDTIELESGERIRYLLVDTPEITGGKNECYGAGARDFNRNLVMGEGKKVTLTYGEACGDRYDRLLAYVSVDGVEVNAELIKRGMGCVMFIPPAGESRQDEFLEYQRDARSRSRGLWANCPADERPAVCPG